MINYHACLESEKYYHIYNRGNNKESIFLSDDNYLFFLSKWKKYILPYTDILTYCLMPNHFHFLIKVKPENSFTKLLKFSKAEQQAADINQFLETQFKKLFTSYALAFNKQQNRTGSLFQKRFKRVFIEDNDKLTQLIHYIHHNPIHHGFTNDYTNWKYSSYNSIVSNKSTEIAKSEVLEWFSTEERFIDFHNEMKHFEGDIYIN